MKTYPKIPYIAIKRVTVPIHVAPHGKVRRSVLRGALDRIQHLPRSHVGASAEDDFLNARASVNFDDTVHSIRAQTAALLKRVHTPIPHAVRPLPISGSYKYIETPIPERINSDAYINVMLLSPNERAMRDIVPMSHYPGTTQQRNSIGRGRLACVSFAAGRVYPRRRLMIFDENNYRNVRNDVQYLSYYTKTRAEAAKQHPKIKLDDEEKVREDKIIKPVNLSHSHVSFQTPLKSEEKLLIPIKTTENIQPYEDEAVFQKEEEIDAWLTHQRKKKSKKNEESNEDQLEELAAKDEQLTTQREPNKITTKSSPPPVPKEVTIEDSSPEITKEEQKLEEPVEEPQETDQLQTSDVQITEQDQVPKSQILIDEEIESANETLPTNDNDLVQEAPEEVKEEAEEEKEVQTTTEVVEETTEEKIDVVERIPSQIAEEEEAEQQPIEENIQQSKEEDVQIEEEKQEKEEEIEDNESKEIEEQKEEEITAIENEIIAPSNEIVGNETQEEEATPAEETEARASIPSEAVDAHEDADIKSIEEVTDIGNEKADERVTEIREPSEDKDCSTLEHKDNDGPKSESEISDLEEDACEAPEKLSVKDTLQPVVDTNLEDSSLVDDVFEAPGTPAENKTQPDLTTTDEECEEDSE